MSEIFKLKLPNISFDTNSLRGRIPLVIETLTEKWPVEVHAGRGRQRKGHTMPPLGPPQLFLSVVVEY